jgi:hypothetical protein
MESGEFTVKYFSKAKGKILSVVKSFGLTRLLEELDVALCCGKPGDVVLVELGYELSLEELLLVLTALHISVCIGECLLLVDRADTHAIPNKLLH